MMDRSVRSSFYAPEFSERIGENRHYLHHRGVLAGQLRGTGWIG
jgi:hypothetical protein